MANTLQELKTRTPGKTITVYPHTGVAIFQIVKLWIMIGIVIGGYIALQNSGKNPLPANIQPMIKTGMFLLAAGGVLFAAHQFLHYANTFIQFTDDAIIYRRGWIPSHTDTIFWVNIKDINTSASVIESTLSSGTIVFVVAIRNTMESVRVSYLPQHEEIASYIRERIGAFNSNISQVSYT